MGEYQYALLENKSELWSRRNDIGKDKLFDSFGFFAGDGASKNSRAPWAVKDLAWEFNMPSGELLYDPATLVRRHFPEGWGAFGWQYGYNPYAYMVEVIDLQVMEDKDWNGSSDPYINLYLRDGEGKERKLLGLSSGLQANWTVTDAPDEAIYVFLGTGLLERYWFYGLKLSDADIFGIEVRDDDGLKSHDWLMDPSERYYSSFLGKALFDFTSSNMTLRTTGPSL